MTDIPATRASLILTVVFASFQALQYFVSEQRQNRIKKGCDKFISLDYTKFPKILAKYALDFIDHVFGFKGDYFPRAFQIIHISICITACAVFLGHFIYLKSYDFLVWIVLNLSFIAVLILLGWKRIKTVVHKKYFWYGYISLISILLLGDYYLDTIFSNRFDIIEWIGTIRFMVGLYVINLFFYFLTVAVTVKTLQRILESGFLVQVLLIICNVIAAYILMIIEYCILVFYLTSFRLTDLGAGLKEIKVVLSVIIKILELNFDNYIDYLTLFIYIIKPPILYIINLHERLDPIKEALNIKYTGAVLSSNILYSSTTLIPTTLYLCILFASVISKLMLQPIRCMLKSISENKDYKIFTAFGYFFVALIGIILLIFF
jgi:hypothetical protein